MSQMLRVRAVGSALVPSHENPKANPRQFVGRVWSEKDGQVFLLDAPEPAELPVRAEYLRALREGSLAPADKPTADLVGLSFDTTAGAKAPPKEA